MPGKDRPFASEENARSTQGLRHHLFSVAGNRGAVVGSAITQHSLALLNLNLASLPDECNKLAMTLMIYRHRSLLQGRKDFCRIRVKPKLAGSGSWRKEHGVDICARCNSSGMTMDIGRIPSSAMMIRMLMIPRCRFEMVVCRVHLTQGYRAAQEQREDGTTNHLLNEGDDPLIDPLT